MLLVYLTRCLRISSHALSWEPLESISSRARQGLHNKFFRLELRAGLTYACSACVAAHPDRRALISGRQVVRRRARDMMLSERHIYFHSGENSSYQ